MKKNLIIILSVILILVLIAIAFYVVCYYVNHKAQVVDEKALYDKYGYTEVWSRNMNIDYVENEETAIRIAKIVFTEILGNDCLENRTLRATFDESYQVWHVYCALDEKQLGGGPNMLISKQDGRILGVWRTK